MFSIRYIEWYLFNINELLPKIEILKKIQFLNSIKLYPILKVKIYPA
jgi:hypothetical protein